MMSNVMNNAQAIGQTSNELLENTPVSEISEPQSTIISEFTKGIINNIDSIQNLNVAVQAEPNTSNMSFGEMLNRQKIMEKFVVETNFASRVLSQTSKAIDTLLTKTQ